MVRIVDYGISTQLKTKKGKHFAHTFVGSSGYMAPEVFEKKYTFSSDVFGYGVLMYLLIFKTNPFPITSIWDYEAVMIAKKPIELPSDIPNDIGDLLLQTLSFDPSERPDFVVICEKLKTSLEPLLHDETCQN